MHGAVSIFTDSQTTLMALNNYYIKSELVSETSDLLDRAAGDINTTTVMKCGIKAHAGHEGNEKADECAKLGATRIQLRVSDPPKMPQSYAHHQIDKLCMRLWGKLVKDLEFEPPGHQCRQTRFWFPEGPRPAVAFTLLRLPRATFAHMVAFLTGHNFLKRHEGIIMETYARQCGEVFVADKSCGFGCVGGDQSTYHLMVECDRFAHLRLKFFGTDRPQLPFLMGIVQVLDYLKAANIETLEIYDTQKQYEQEQQWTDSADSQSDSDH